jgi:acetyl-CoA C-acetyltransferase
MGETVVVGYARTPFGTFGGGLKDIPATDLGAHAIRHALRRAGVDGADVDYVYMGQVVQAGAGQIPSRQASMKAGCPESVPSDTINKVCASSLRAVNIADMAIRLGESRIVVAGGMESMSQAPYLLAGARWGLRMGDATLVDSVVYDGLTCSFGHCHMGVYGSEVAKEFGITREAQDAWAYRSHQRALAAMDRGRLAEEIVPIDAPGKRGIPVTVTNDEAPRRDTSPDKLAALKPAFQPDGTVTAGNAPGLSDGATALVLMDRAEAERRGLDVLATIVSQAQVSEAPRYLHTVPARAGLKALQRVGLSVRDLALVEINEAFAAVTLTSIQVAELDPDIVNVNGGAVALGHPIGASGGRILMTLIQELRHRGGGYGLAAICSGGGQGEATVVRVD